MITVTLEIAAIAALVVSIKLLRSLTIVMLEKMQLEEHRRKSFNQRNAAILWGMNVDEQRA